jgi:predicted HTH domain antitoxin
LLRGLGSADKENAVVVWCVNAINSTLGANRVEVKAVSMSKITIEVDDTVLRILGDSPEQIERQALEMIALELYRRHAVSAGRAAEILGMDELAFIRWSGSLGIPYFDLSAEQWEREVRVLDTL